MQEIRNDNKQNTDGPEWYQQVELYNRYNEEVSGKDVFENDASGRVEQRQVKKKKKGSIAWLPASGTDR